MDKISEKEFNWNLKRLLREGYPEDPFNQKLSREPSRCVRSSLYFSPEFPQTWTPAEGIPSDDLSSTYCRWLGKSVLPSTFQPGCKNWEEVFRVSELLNKTFFVTVDKDPLVKIKEGIKESDDDLEDVLEMAQYSNLELVRLVRNSVMLNAFASSTVNTANYANTISTDTVMAKDDTVTDISSKTLVRSLPTPRFHGIDKAVQTVLETLPNLIEDLGISVNTNETALTTVVESSIDEMSPEESTDIPAPASTVITPDVVREKVAVIRTESGTSEIEMSGFNNSNSSVHSTLVTKKRKTSRSFDPTYNKREKFTVQILLDKVHLSTRKSLQHSNLAMTEELQFFNESTLTVANADVSPEIPNNMPVSALAHISEADIDTQPTLETTYSENLACSPEILEETGKSSGILDTEPTSISIWRELMGPRGFKLYDLNRQETTRARSGFCIDPLAIPFPSPLEVGIEVVDMITDLEIDSPAKEPSPPPELRRINDTSIRAKRSSACNNVSVQSTLTSVKRKNSRRSNETELLNANSKKERLNPLSIVSINDTDPLPTVESGVPLLAQTKLALSQVILPGDPKPASMTENSVTSTSRTTATDCGNQPESALPNTSESTSIETSEGINSFCDVCGIPHSKIGNLFCFCDSCKISVHQVCYGIPELPSSTWLCRTCSLGIEPRCVFCPNLGGAMKMTSTDHEWAHVSCAVWIPEISAGFGSTKFMEPIANFGNITSGRRRLRCSICKIKDWQDACIKCSEENCEESFHVTCALRKRFEMIAVFDNENKNNVSLKSYCANHGRGDPRKENKQEAQRTTAEKSNGLTAFEHFIKLCLDRPSPKSHEKLEEVRQVVPKVSVEPKRPQLLSIYDLTCNTLVFPRFENKMKYLDGYDCELKKTTLLHEVDPARRLSALVSHGKNVYDIGGSTKLDVNWRNDKISSNFTDIFHAEHPVAVQRLNLIDSRKDFAACVCRNYIYAIGGYQGAKVINSVERLKLDRGFELTTNTNPRWVPIRSMALPRAGHDVAVLINRIYVVGGIGRVVPRGDVVDLSTVVVYNVYHNSVYQNTWQPSKPMNEPRGYVKTAVMNNQIYAVGGDVLDRGFASVMYPNRRSLDTVEVYCPVRNSWGYCATMNHPRSCGMVVVQNDLLYAIGGDSKENSTMEVYDPRIEKWILLDWPVNLPKGADLFSAITVNTQCLRA